MSVFQITIGQCFYFSLGVGIAVTTRVANKLGAGDPEVHAKPHKNTYNFSARCAWIINSDIM